MIFTYVRHTPGTYFPHEVRYPNGSLGTRTDEGYAFRRNRLPCDHNIVEILPMEDYVPSKSFGYASAVADFIISNVNLNSAEKNVNKWVDSEMEKCKTVESLMELVNMLPKSYKGSRRIYEKIYTIQDAQKMGS